MSVTSLGDTTRSVPNCQAVVASRFIACPATHAKTIATHCAQRRGRSLIRAQVAVAAEDVHGRLQLIVNARIRLVEVVYSKTAGNIVVLHPGKLGAGMSLEQIDRGGDNLEFGI
jgi:hypothetical protein